MAGRKRTFKDCRNNTRGITRRFQNIRLQPHAEPIEPPTSPKKHKRNPSYEELSPMISSKVGHGSVRQRSISIPAEVLQNQMHDKDIVCTLSLSHSFQGSRRGGTQRVRRESIERRSHSEKMSKIL